MERGLPTKGTVGMGGVILLYACALGGWTSVEFMVSLFAVILKAVRNRQDTVRNRENYMNDRLID